jgi:hypothetical protein
MIIFRIRGGGLGWEWEVAVVARVTFAFPLFFRICRIPEGAHLLRSTAFYPSIEIAIFQSVLEWNGETRLGESGTAPRITIDFGKRESKRTKFS